MILLMVVTPMKIVQQVVVDVEKGRIWSRKLPVRKPCLFVCLLVLDMFLFASMFAACLCTSRFLFLGVACLKRDDSQISILIFCFCNVF